MAQTPSRSSTDSNTSFNKSFSTGSSTFFKQFVPAYRFTRIGETVFYKNHFFHAELNSASIKVLNWNIAKNNHASEWTSEFSAILEEHDPDLVFLQEVRLTEDVKLTSGLAKMSWCFAPNFVDAFHNSFSGILTAAKAKHVNRRSILTHHYEPITKTPKVSLVTECSLPHTHQTLLIVNTHVINFVDLRKFQAQLHKLEQIIAAHPGPVVLSGDFNTWSQSRGLLLQGVAARLGLTQVSFSPYDHLKIKRFLLSPPLDYIFYRGLQEKPLTAKVLDHVSSSDHKPLLVELSCEGG